MKLEVFSAAYAFTRFYEGKTSTDKYDPGNWTGGKVGKGIFKGTKQGISAAAYPDLDIMNLTEYEIKTICFRDYWVKCGAERFAKKAPMLACRLYDLSINCGVRRASKMLQHGINAVCFGELLPVRQAAWRQAIAKLTKGQPLRVDGSIGPITADIIMACPHPAALHAALCGEAYNHYKQCDPGNRAGWLNRLDAFIDVTKG